MERQSLPIIYRLGERRVSGGTTFLDAGASVLVLTSCSAELGLELRGSYLAGERRGELLVAESGVLGGAPAEFSARYISALGQPIIYERARLLYDHLLALQDLAIRGGLGLAVDVLDEAFTAFASGPKS